jgi:hypothetical protein
MLSGRGTLGLSRKIILQVTARPIVLFRFYVNISNSFEVQMKRDKPKNIGHTSIF